MDQQKNFIIMKHIKYFESYPSIRKSSYVGEAEVYDALLPLSDNRFEINVSYWFTKNVPNDGGILIQSTTSNNKFSSYDKESLKFLVDFLNENDITLTSIQIYFNRSDYSIYTNDHDLSNISDLDSLNRTFDKIYLGFR